MTEEILPDGFEDLAQFVPQWVYSTEKARNEFRVSQSQDDLQQFYDALLPRLNSIVNALSDYNLEALPRAAANLLELALMCMEVAPAVEYYNHPDVPNSVEYGRFEIYSVKPQYRIIES